MPRLRNTVTGVVVNVDDDLAAQLGAAWEPAGEGKPAGSTRKRSRAKDADAGSADQH